MDVLLKTCQYFVHWSDSDLLGIRKSSDCCRYLILLFVYLSCLENGHDGEWNSFVVVVNLFSLSILTSAVDYVAHSVARMQPRTLREGWSRVMQEDSTKICDELEKSNARIFIRCH